MTSQNNTYLYNFILSSSILNYDAEYTPILGLDGSLALYLFHYSKELFFTYPIIFDKCSIISDSNLFVNICYSFIHNVQPVNYIKYDGKFLSFRYLDKFDFNIHTQHNDPVYSEIYTHNEPQNIEYNGLNFAVPPIESVVAYCIHQYSKNKKDFNSLINILVLSGIYKTRILLNNILINLLRLNINLTTTIKQILKDIHKMTIFSVQNCPLEYKLMKQRTLEVLEFCHG